jgi:GR25 family glycosyltransferase involved in LPS biosynthesis
MSDFPPIYIITLREDLHRRRETQKHFDSQGLTPVWFNGINGVAAGIASVVPHDSDLSGQRKYIHPSVVGTTISHLFALERGLMSGEGEFFIMEDDVVLCEDFRNSWEKARECIPDDIEVVQLAVTVPEDKPSSPINDIIEHRYYPFCTTCNWWRRSAAEFAVKVLRPFNSPVDIMLMQRVYPFVGHAITIDPMAWDHSYHSKGGKWPRSVSPSGISEL